MLYPPIHLELVASLASVREPVLLQSGSHPLSYLLLPFLPFFVVGFMRNNAIVNWIAVEVSALFILWILWVVTAARTSDWNNALSALCKEAGLEAGNKALNDEDAQGIQAAQSAQTFCHEMQAVEGLSFVVWIFILFYVGTILTNAFLAMSRGNKKIWTTSVVEADFSARPQNDRFPMTSAKTEPSPMYQQPQYQQPQYTGQQGYNGAPAPVVQSMNTGGYNNHGNMPGQV